MGAEPGKSPEYCWLCPSPPKYRLPFSLSLCFYELDCVTQGFWKHNKWNVWSYSDVPFLKGLYLFVCFWLEKKSTIFLESTISRNTFETGTAYFFHQRHFASLGALPQTGTSQVLFRKRSWLGMSCSRPQSYVSLNFIPSMFCLLLILPCEFVDLLLVSVIHIVAPLFSDFEREATTWLRLS